MKRNKGITLIALVIIIIVLLILAGVSIAALSGDNGILTMATRSKEEAARGDADDIIKIVISEWKIEKYTGDKTITEFLDDNNEIDGWKDNGDGTYEIEVNGYVGTIDESGNIVEETQKAGPRPQVSDIKVVLASDGSGTGLEARTQREGTTLYINFNHSIENGTTLVSPSLPYPVTENGRYAFTVTGTVGGETYTKNVNVTVNQYDTTVQIGTYVKYNVTYTDMYTDYEFTEIDGWRVLDPGTENPDGTYTGTKLISTGIPANLYYDDTYVASSSWAGTSEQITNYTNKFYVSHSNTSSNMYASAGLYYNFGKIVFNQGTNVNQNQGYYTKVNGKTSGSLSETEFLVDGATEVHNLTMYELNKARNQKAGSYTYALNHTEGASSYSRITSSNDAATGLFYLTGLADKFNYTTDTSPYYWLASPNASSNISVLYVDYISNISNHYYGTNGVRAVVSLPSNVALEIVGN